MYSLFNSLKILYANTRAIMLFELISTAQLRIFVLVNRRDRVIYRYVQDLTMVGKRKINVKDNKELLNCSLITVFVSICVNPPQCD